MYLTVTRRDTSPSLPENSSTAVTNARRFRIVASMPGRGMVVSKLVLRIEVSAPAWSRTETQAAGQYHFLTSMSVKRRTAPSNEIRRKEGAGGFILEHRKPARIQMRRLRQAHTTTASFREIRKALGTPAPLPMADERGRKHASLRASRSCSLVGHALSRKNFFSFPFRRLPLSDPKCSDIPRGIPGSDDH